MGCRSRSTRMWRTIMSSAGERRFDFEDIIEAKPGIESAIAPMTAIRWTRSCETTALR